jgi:hypothetical protein
MRFFRLHSVHAGSGAHPVSSPKGTVFSAGVKRPGREADHSLSDAEVKNTWIYTSIPSWRGIELIEHRDNVIFYFKLWRFLRVET